MRQWVAALFVSAAVSASAWAGPSTNAPATGSPHPDLDLPVEGVITNPEWLRTPNGEDFSDDYPGLASSLGLGGRVVLHCIIAVDGGMDHCDVTSEAPRGMGFGDAAIAMAGAFRMRPQTVDGRPVAGSVINIPIRFQPPATDDSDQPAESEPTTPPDPKRLVLAQQLAKAVHWDVEESAEMQALENSFANQAGVQGLTTEQTIAVNAIKAAGEDFVRGRVEQRERKLADAFTEPELAKLVQLFSTPEGQVWFSRIAEIDKSAIQSNRAAWSAMMDNARASFCRQVGCVDAPAAASRGATVK